MQNPNAVDNPFGTNTEELYNQYKEYYDKVVDLTFEAEERLNDVNASIIDSYEDIADRQEKVFDGYDKINKELERTSDRVALWQGEDAYGEQAKIDKQRAKTAQKAAEEAYKIYRKYDNQLEKARAKQEAERPKRIADAQAEVNRIQAALNKDKNNKDLQQQLANAKVVLAQAKYDDSEEVQ